jgi:hypothetical protein
VPAELAGGDAPLTIATATLLVGAALLAGIANAIAGGGMFFAFPAMVFVGVSPLLANSSCSVALWPGLLSGVWAYRREALDTDDMRPLLIASALGGGIGALLLLRTPPTTFERLVPWLLLLATLLFALNAPLSARLRPWFGRAGGARTRLPLLLAVQFGNALYGGFFGAGVGFMILATLGLLTGNKLPTLFGLRLVLSATINAVAVVLFLAAGAVVWPHTLLMLAGALVGGYFGAALLRRLNPGVARLAVITLGAAMTAYFFIRG